LHGQQFEKDKQNDDFAPPGRIPADAMMVCFCAFCPTLSYFLNF